MYMYSQNMIEEIASSFVNGNISHVKQKLYGKRKLKFAVYEFMKEMGWISEAKVFTISY